LTSLPLSVRFLRALNSESVNGMGNYAAASLEHAANSAIGFVINGSILWWKIPALASAAILLFVTLRPRSARRPRPETTLNAEDLLYILVLALFLFAFRWPSLGLSDLDGDESVAVSAALTRYLAPTFGLTLFTGSGGPLLSYPLALFGVLGLRIDYGVSKLLSLLLLTATWAVIYLALRTFTSGGIARVALLPVLVFFGHGNETWTMMYCSEHWLNFLIALMIYCLLRLAHQVGGERPNLVGVGLAFGFIPLVKWQGLPMGALFILLTLVLVAHPSPGGAFVPGAFVRKALLLLALGVGPFLLWCAVVGASGNLDYFLRTYVLALMTQANTRFETTLLERLVAFPSWGLSPFANFTWFVYALGAFLLLAIGYLLRNHEDTSSGAPLLALSDSRSLFRELAPAILYLAVSFYAVLKPGGPFPHYLNLLLQPYVLLVVVAFCHMARRSRYPWMVVGLYLAITLCIPAARYYLGGAPLVTLVPRTSIETDPTLDAPASYALIRRLTPPGSPIILWGWDYHYYVYSGMIWGTRTGGSHEIIEPFFGDRRLFIDSYVASLASDRAPVFLDTATEGARSYSKRAVYGHEAYPEVASVVRQHYLLCREFTGARIFVNRRYDETHPGLRDLCDRPPT